MESRRNGPQLSSRHDDDDDDMYTRSESFSKNMATDACESTRIAHTLV